MNEDKGMASVESERLAAVTAWEEARSAWLAAQAAAEAAMHLVSEARAGWKKALLAAAEAKRMAWISQKAARAAGGRGEEGEAEARAIWAAERAEKSAWASWEHAKKVWMDESSD